MSMIERMEETNRGFSSKSKIRPHILIPLDIIIVPYYCIKNVNRPFQSSFFFRYSRGLRAYGIKEEIKLKSGMDIRS